MASFLQRIAKKMSLFSSDIGIDLGTATVLVYVKGKGQDAGPTCWKRGRNTNGNWNKMESHMHLETATEPEPRRKTGGFRLCQD